MELIKREVNKGSDSVHVTAAQDSHPLKALLIPTDRKQNKLKYYLEMPHQTIFQSGRIFSCQDNKPKNIKNNNHLLCP